MIWHLSWLGSDPLHLLSLLLDPPLAGQNTHEADSKMLTQTLEGSALKINTTGEGNEIMLSQREKLVSGRPLASSEAGIDTQSCLELG